MPKSYKLVLDIGTTGIKGFVFDSKNEIVGKSYLKLNKKISGLKVEQNPVEILSKSKLVLRRAVKNSGVKLGSIKTFGLTNQRETIVAWDKTNGKPIYPAIVWEDSRTKSLCTKIAKIYAKQVKSKTGLAVEPYFSASKIGWILNNVPKAKVLQDKQSLMCGTLDTWILWNFDKTKPYITDQTNASRTLLYNVKKMSWDKELCKIFKIDRNILPEVKPSANNFGMLDKSILGKPVPIQAMCGDQQSSTYAAGTKTGATKATFGTGTFIVQVLSNFLLKPGFYTTIIPEKNKKFKYALEAKIEQSGVQVANALKNKKLLPAVMEKLAEKTSEVIYRLPNKPKIIIVDGGITQSELLIKFLQQRSGIKIQKQTTYDGTALGIAKLLK